MDNIYINKNPCTSCNKDWSVDSKTTCHDTCEDWQLYQDCLKLKEYQNKDINKLNRIRNEFIEGYEPLTDGEIALIYKIFEFIKGKY